jgi:hypothetical protein
MAAHAPPSRAPKLKESDALRRRPAVAPRPRCLGAAAQLEAINRTLNGAPIQRRAAPAKTAGGMIGGIAKGIANAFQPAPRAANRTGLPDRLKTGVEAASGLAMDDVRVHRNSPEPAKLGALAYTQGSDIHLGPGQEEHLPHEAWHVVQQKQRRVRATTQMKGIGVNDDTALEREADHMGGAVLSPLRPFPDTHKATILTAIVQRQVKFKGELLEVPKTGSSKVVEDCINAPEAYRMRGDWEKDKRRRDGNLKKKDAKNVGFFDTYIHLIDESLKYILGEKHKSGKWEEETRHWDVDKMREERTTIPREAEPGAEAFDEKLDPQNLPLESTHASLLTSALSAHDQLNFICSEIWISTWQAKKSNLVDSVKPILSDLEDVQTMYAWYSRFAKIYKDTGLQSDNKLGLVNSFSIWFSKHIEEVAELHQMLSSLVPPKPNDPKVPTAQDSESVKQFKDDIASINFSRMFLSTMVTKLLEIIEFADANEKAELGALSKFRDRGDPVAVIIATNPSRERAMAANILAKDPPLLVQVGTGHIEGLADELSGKPNIKIFTEKQWLRDETRKE